MINSREELIEVIKADGAEDWKSVMDALEDAEYLMSVGDTNINIIEDAHDLAETMFMLHPTFKFGDV